MISGYNDVRMEQYLRSTDSFSSPGASPSPALKFILAFVEVR